MRNNLYNLQIQKPKYNNFPTTPQRTINTSNRSHFAMKMHTATPPKRRLNELKKYSVTTQNVNNEDSSPFSLV